MDFYTSDLLDIKETTKIFTVFDEDISISTMVPFYMKTLKSCSKVQDKVLAEIESKLLGLQEPATIIQWLSSEIEGYAKEMVGELSKFGIYDLAASDFIDDNTGLIKAGKITLAYLEYIVDFTEESKLNLIQQKLDYAKSEYGNVRGLDYGIISSDPIAHLVYGMQNDAAVNRQTQDAYSRYQAKSYLAEIESSRKMKDEKKQTYCDEFAPEVKEGASEAVVYLIHKYFQILSEARLYKKDEVDCYSQERSDELLKNIDVVDDKERLILEALKKCPFNANVYVQCVSIDQCDDLLPLMYYVEIDSKVKVTFFCSKIEEYPTLQTTQDAERITKEIIAESSLFSDDDTDSLLKIAYRILCAEKQRDIRELLSYPFEVNQEGLNRWITVRKKSENRFRYIDEFISDEDKNKLLEVLGEKDTLNSIVPAVYLDEVGEYDRLDSYNKFVDENLVRNNARLSSERIEQQRRQEQQTQGKSSNDLSGCLLGWGIIALIMFIISWISN